MTIGKKIVDLRKKAKLSQEALAEKLGITRQTLSNYENDITSPDLLQTKKIGEVLDVSIDELVENNTLARKVSSTEKMVKIQGKNLKILLIIIYLIIMLLLLSFIIYMVTKKDFTKEYQMEYICHHKKEDTLSISLETKDDSTQDFYLIICSSLKESNNCQSTDKLYAGKSIGEAILSSKLTKKVLLSEGYTCY